MKIKNIKIFNFKRFTNLNIKDIPETTKLVVLLGSNGSGKTSLLEAFNFYNRNDINTLPTRVSNGEKQEYFLKIDSLKDNNVVINFHNYDELIQKIKNKFYFRSAYRNEQDLNIKSLQKQTDLSDEAERKNPNYELKLKTLNQNDVVISENYQRLISNTLNKLYKNENDSKTVKELRNEIIEKIQNSLKKIFDDLEFDSIGDPLVNGNFYFNKGASKNFHYKNLSAGEKAVFDLVLDIVIKCEYYNDSIFCIDEPEAHINTKLQGKVLRELFDLTPDNSQLWVATHSIGMLKEAQNIEKENSNSVIFLDFDNKDFDIDVEMFPSKLDKTLLKKFYELAFGEMSSLVAPETIVFCEGSIDGNKNKNFDAQIYNKIFENSYPNIEFVSVGSSSEIIDENNTSIKIITSALSSSKIIKLIDRDDMHSNEIKELQERNIRVLSKRHIECYLFDDEIIKKLCNTNNNSTSIEQCLKAKQDAIQESIKRGKPTDDVKSASGNIYSELKKIIQLSACGNNTSSFCINTLAPLITEETEVYKALEKEIFGKK